MNIYIHRYKYIYIYIYINCEKHMFTVFKSAANSVCISGGVQISTFGNIYIYIYVGVYIISQRRSVALASQPFL